LAFAVAGRLFSLCSRRWHSAAAFFSSGEEAAGAELVVAFVAVVLELGLEEPHPARTAAAASATSGN
jgi:hypothetical protein